MSTLPSGTTSTTTFTSPSSSTSLLPLDALFNNPLFAGGLGLASLGAVAAVGRRGVVRGASLVKKRLLINVEISKRDPSYQWILNWLSIPRPQAGFITSRLTRIHDFSINTISRNAENGGATKAHMALQPGYGKYKIRHKNAYLQVNREKQSTANMQTGEPHETVTLTTLYAHRHIFEDIFGEAHHMAMTAQEGKTVMYTCQGHEWKPFGDPRKKRPLQSVVLDEGIKERIVDDVKDFLARQSWYVDRGIPYRRGYLLYGPPGSGKSSFIQGLAGELDFGVAIINLSERGMTDDKLAHLLTKLPSKTILLLEDADSAFRNRRQVDEDGYSGGTVTFSGLLNALDGVAAGEERIAFLTTNHVDRLDEALIRPGRVDMTVRIGEATRHQAGEMWDRFFGDVDTDGKGKERFLQRLKDLDLVEGVSGEGKKKMNTSTAAIQGLFLFNKDDMDGAIKMAEGLIPRVYEPESPVEGIKVSA
ncbi:probable BCS1 protein precursor [Rhynchosporium secalis]|uniref:Probable BCS1 protein n=1 Tax=Rhynchosporium secalis TaxID=38038 RepID=A0A1E1LYW5_RHYSE|nr:probable BCS1 protein precursor [Rhynchosporium secalis]